jgi:peptidyl-prolyl cis-trans isomerase SurA
MAALVGAFAVASATAPLSAQDAPPAMHRGHHDTSQQQPLEGGPPVANEAAIVEPPKGDAVAATVNDSVISEYDLRQRVALFIATSNIHPTDEVRKQIRDQVLKQLETERLELLEAQKNKVSVSSSEVDKAIDDIMKDNHLTADQLKSVLAGAGVQMATFRSQIAAQIAWSKLVQDQLGDRVHVSKEDVQAELGRIKENSNKPQFQVSEIFQPVDTPEQDAKVHKDMDDLANQISLGAPFQAVARQFSQNPTAAQGGDMGWVQDGQLAPELNAALGKLQVGQVSPSIRSVGGYYLLALRDRREPAGTKLPDPKQVQQAQYPAGELPLDRILFPLSPKTPKNIVEAAGQAAAKFRAHIEGCDHLQEFVGKAFPSGGVQFYSLGLTKLAELSSEIQTAVSETHPGEATPPFGSSAGIEIIVRCDKPVFVPQVIQIPTQDAVEQQLYEDQISTLARQYLRDLRRDADIETR